ncbi:hypothetical protein Bca52824_050086 [Brassica carinata]|uniref:Uncharacterized protein n=1 Tax=Brassica carinata TaxID=52824 RepID=A0A8X7RM77_BRACI|nr:hypothetical protein Bca52824_050086 [Brassica carinata]
MHHESQPSSSFHLYIKAEFVLRPPPPDRLLLRRNCFSPWHEASSIQVTSVSRPALTHRQLLLESIYDAVLSASICLQLPVRSQHSSLTSMSLPLLLRTSSSQLQVSKL